MAMEARASEVTVDMQTKILSTVQTRTALVICMELVAAPRRTVVTVSKGGLVLIAPCVPALLDEPGLDAPRVGTTMPT